MSEPRFSGARPSRRVIGAAALVSIALLGANALAYVFTVVAARALVPSAFGELAALLSVLLVGSVPATGVQTVAALFLGGRDGDGSPVVGRLHATAVVCGLAVTTVGLLAIAPTEALLHLEDPAAMAWLAVLLLPHTLIAGYQGILQGTHRYARLAVVAAGFGGAKIAGGTAGLLLGGTPTAALVGMTVGAAIGAAGGWAGCSCPGLRRGLRAPALATVRASAALLGFVLLLNLDLLLARHHLPAAAAGEYAVGAIFTKVAFWLPQGVGVVLLPRLADAGRRRRLLGPALALVAGVGAVLTLATAALGGDALPLVGGSAYGDSLGAAAWSFAALGTLLAVAQLLLYSDIAAAGRLPGVLVWSAVVLEAAAVELLAVTGAVSTVAVIASATLTTAVLVAVGLVRVRRDATVPEPSPGRPVPLPG
jgi:O-antigen/teichoic acid export membrane protein